jgi:RecB family exonuclease
VTIAEAHAVNRVLHRIFHGPAAADVPTDVADAARVLARGANKVLGAGWRPEDVPPTTHPTITDQGEK